MHRKSIYYWFGIALTVLLNAGVHSVFAQTNYPLCTSAELDSDGDGWGWENNRSCVVSGGVSQNPEDTNTNRPVYPTCSALNSDPDGDGFGFENGVSCVVDVSSQPKVSRNYAVCTTNSDSDGDGYGYENGESCITPATATVVETGGFPVCLSTADTDGDGYGWESNRTCVFTDGSSKSAKQGSNNSAVSVADITDVILATGQSNLLGSHTRFDVNLDQSHPRVFAFTDKGWQIADLHQVWDVYAHPGNHSLDNPANKPYNNFVFHFGKTLAAADSNRVVAYIVASAPGKGIANWDKGTAFYQFVSDKVNSALWAIPHKYSVDGILWQQGENDWLYEGTSDYGATGFSSRNSDEYRNYYKIKLENLISNFRKESWGRGDTAFICGETRRAEGVNRRLMALNNDNDQLTACVPATDLPKRTDDPYGSHFSADGLRELGKRFALQYRAMTGS